MNETRICAVCHASYRGLLDPHEFVVAIPEKCWKCHSPKALGRSHPIGVNPKRSIQDIKVPEDIPLEDGKVSCGSCHNPHLEYIAKTMAFPFQDATFIQREGRLEIPWYKTYYLRKPDPVKGFETLCTACHRDY